MRCLDASSLRLKLLVAAILILGSSVGAVAQQQLPPISTRPPASPGQAPSPSDDNDQDSMARRAMIQQAQRRNNQRQQDIVNATAKLLTLTEQLKTELEKNSKDQNSVNMSKQAEAIEKLARSVKDKMKGS